MLKVLFNTAAVKVLNAIVLLVSVILCTNTLGKEVFGEVSLFLLNVSVIMLFTDLISGSSVIYYASRIHKKQLVSLGAIWIILVTLIVSAVVYSIGILFYSSNSLEIGALWYLVVGGFFVGISTLIHNYLIGRQKMQQYNIAYAIQIVLFIFGLAITLLLFKMREASAYFIAYISSYVLSLIYCVGVIHATEDNSSLKPSKLVFTELLYFGYKAQFANLFQLINRRLSYYVIKALLGIGSLGLFSVAIQLSEGLKIIGQSIAQVQFSHISNQKDKKIISKYTLGMLKVNVVITSFALLVLILIPSSFYSFVFGEGFGVVKGVILSLAPGIIGLAASQNMSTYFSGTGNPKHNMIGSLFGAIIMVIFIYPAIKIWGLPGAGIIISTSFWTSFLYQFYQFRKQTMVKLVDIIINKSDVAFIRKELTHLFKK